MTLRVSDFDQYILLSDRIDYTEAYLGEAKAINLTFTTATTPPVAKNITGWTFAVSYKDALANVSGAVKSLSSITNFVLLSSTPQTDTNLAVSVTNATGGLAILTIPSTVTSMPASDAPIDGTNTLIKLITIQATYASTVSGFNTVDKYNVGVIIRFN